MLNLEMQKTEEKLDITQTTPRKLAVTGGIGDISLALKLSVRAQRPNSDTKYDSFPSGHASAAFAFATNVALRHEWYWNFVSVPLALWATTARISDDSHHVHDSIFGAALGMSFALGMNYLAGDVPFLLGFEPMDEGGSVTFNFNF